MNRFCFVLCLFLDVLFRRAQKIIFPLGHKFQRASCYQENTHFPPSLLDSKLNIIIFFNCSLTVFLCLSGSYSLTSKEFFKYKNENICKSVFSKGLISKMYKELI